jgi:hypothetical protein
MRSVRDDLVERPLPQPGLRRFWAGRHDWPLKPIVVVTALAAAGVVGMQALERNMDHEHCYGWTPFKGVEPAYFQRALDLCVEGRQAYRSGPFGLLGPSDKGRAAGWCAQFWAAVEVPPNDPSITAHFVARYPPTGAAGTSAADKARFMGNCIPERIADVRSRGRSD